MNKKYSVYWIHSAEETDITTQGYVGISNDLSRRLSEHKAKKWYSTRLVEVYAEGTIELCKAIERELRPKKNVGLNIAAGGGLPPNHTGKIRSATTRALISKNNVGFKGRKHSPETIARMRSAKAGKPGRPQSEATKKKLSEARRKFLDTPDTKEKT
jgi:predicted GIY-YIG superfamily endonuclease